MKATLLTATVLALDATALLAGNDPLAAGLPRPGAPSLVSVVQVIQGASSQDVFRHPSGLVVDAKRGVFLVADKGNHRLVLFDSSGRSRGSISFQAHSKGEVPGEPLTLATDSSGRLFVVDAGQGRIRVLTSRGSHLGFLMSPDTADSGTPPRAVDIGVSGSIYVLYGGPRARVAVLDPAGRTREGYGFALGSEPIGSAVSLAVNETAGLMAIVSPNAEKQVRLYGLDGRLEAEFGAHGEGDGTFSLAGHAAWGPENSIWITDTLRHSISVFDARGGYVGRIGGFGRNPGQFCFPVACGFLADGRLIVLERGTARCQILEVQMIPPDPLSLDPIDPVSATMNVGSMNLIGGDPQ